MLKQSPVGLSDYKQLREGNYYYVDKTLLVQDMYGGGCSIVISRPDGFGKSLNLSMLRYFYEINEESQESLFSDTAIWQIPQFRAQQGKFPVIFISFKTITDITLDSMMAKFAEVIGEEYKRHAYLLDGDVLNEREIQIFKALMSGSAYRFDLSRSFEFLLTALSEYHNEHVIVLIDDYDIPVQVAYMHGFYEEIMPLTISLLIGVLKDQGEKRGSDVHPSPSNRMFAGLNNLVFYTLTGKRMERAFGFDQSEVEKLLAYYQLEGKLQKIRDSCDGYALGETRHIFNSRSVLEAAFNEGLTASPALNGTAALVKTLIGRGTPCLKENLRSLLLNEPVVQGIERSIVFPDLKHGTSLVWSILLYSGYVTYTTFKMHDYRREWFLVLPNKESVQVLSDLIAEIFAESCLEGGAQSLLDAFLEGESAAFSRHLQSFIEASMNAYAISDDEPERCYSLFMLGLFVMLRDSYGIKANGGFGTCDVLIIPKDTNKPGVIIVFERIWSYKKAKLEPTAQKALDRIESENYQQDFSDRGIHLIIAYGIAVEGRTVLLKCMCLENKNELACDVGI